MKDFSFNEIKERKIEEFFNPFENKSIWECWDKNREWKDRYSSVYINGRQIRSHRFAYLVFYGYLNNALYVCHRCDNPKCVNPHHLFLGSQKDNMNDMRIKGRSKSHNKSKTHCMRGHIFDDDNTVYYRDSVTGNEKRYCKKCEKIRDKIKISKRRDIRLKRSVL